MTMIHPPTKVLRLEICLLAPRRIVMPRKRHKPEEIVTRLRQVDVLVSQGQGIVDAIRRIGVSEVACVTSCSTAKSSTRCGRLRSSSKAGDATTIRSARMPLSATGHQHRRSSCLHYPRDRLSYADRLRRPRWRYRQPSTNIPPGPLNVARSDMRWIAPQLSDGLHCFSRFWAQSTSLAT